MSIGGNAGASAAFAASRVPFEHGLYVIGPFAGRVSFASQQRRAVSLVAAVHHEYSKGGMERGLENKQIAIIGAGLAGLTAAIACASHGALVWVFEKESKILQQMRQSTHRDVHPTINFWPVEDVEPSTFLPFFNWHQGSCDTIINRVIAEWETLRRQFSGKIKGVWDEVTVSGIKHCPNDPSKWNLEFRAGSKNPPQNKSFDCVFVATGFGVENHADNCETGSYWALQDDKILPITLTEEELEYTRYVVSGAGDGGVIEVLRLLFKDFRAGRIEAHTEAILSSPDIRQQVVDIESEARRKFVDATLHEDFPREQPESINEIYAGLWKGYRDIAVGPDLDKDELEAFLSNRSAVSKVMLLGVRDTPIEYQVSPYHKLLLAIAIENGLVDYYCYDGEMTAVDGVAYTINYEVSVRDAADPRVSHRHWRSRTIKAKRLSFKAKHRIVKGLPPGDIKEIAQETTNWNNCFYVSRHGYDSPMEKLFEDFPAKGPLRSRPSGDHEADSRVDQIRRRQALYADHDLLTRAQADIYAKACYDINVSDSADWADVNIELANNYFEETHGVTVFSEVRDALVGEEGEVSEQQEVTTYSINLAENILNRSLYAATQSTIPTRFVGIKVSKNRGQPMRVQTRPEGHASPNRGAT